MFIGVLVLYLNDTLNEYKSITNDFTVQDKNKVGGLHFAVSYCA